VDLKPGNIKYNGTQRISLIKMPTTFFTYDVFLFNVSVPEPQRRVWIRNREGLNIMRMWLAFLCALVDFISVVSTDIIVVAGLKFTVSVYSIFFF